MGSLVGLGGAAQLEVFGVSNLGELGGSLLRLVEVVVNRLEARVLLGVFTLLKAVKISKAINFFLILSSLLLELLQLVGEVVDVLAESEGRVTLLLHIALRSEDFRLSSGDLLAGGSDVSRQVVIRSVLLVKKETSIFNFFLEALESNQVGVVTGLEVIVLKELFILQVSVLGLDGVKLISQGEVVLVALLNFEDLSLELGNKEVLLV